MVGVPADAPVTTPVAALTVASAVLLLLHVPPVTVLPKAVVRPTHTFVVPVMATGVVFTVRLAVA